MKKILTIVMVAIKINGLAQTDTTPSPLAFSGYIEAYYTYDLGKPSNQNRPSFVYSHNRHSEVNLNLGFIKAAYQKEQVRANLTLMTGTYANANLTAEPGVLKNIFEANAGIKLSKKNNLWIDAGIFASHIGFESAIGKDCWTLTRSVLADNSPYFESGAKISYTSDNGKWFLSALLLNGWQRIQRVAGNNTLALGHQLTVKPDSKITLNSSSWIGNDHPDSVRQMRYFHNLYGVFQLTGKLAVTTGLDLGAEQKSKGSRQYNIWYSPVIILRISADAKNNFTMRAEYFSDANEVIINTGTPDSFKIWGYSANYDRRIRENVMWRMEARSFSGKDKTFEKDGRPVNNNFSLTTAIAISF